MAAVCYIGLQNGSKLGWEGQYTSPFTTPNFIKNGQTVGLWNYHIYLLSKWQPYTILDF